MEQDRRTPRLVALARLRIIQAMLDGRITPAEALRRQGLPNMELLMVDSEHDKRMDKLQEVFSRG